MIRSFIVGCPRSGTTLLQTFLGAHPEIYTEAETHYFVKPPRRRFRSRWAKQFVREWDTKAKGLAGWVEKTPRHLHQIKLISRHIPEALFLHMRRAALDTIASLYLTTNLHDGWAAMSLDQCIKQWRRCQLDHQRWISPNHLHVSYANLAQYPAMTLYEVCEFLGVDYDERMLDRIDPPENAPWHNRARSTEVAYTPGVAFGRLSPEQQRHVLNQIYSN